ncbi:conserved protein of unknown function [Pseudomonas sp. JV551A1]|uniref:FlxA-like protein n=1 Tax=Pseudomonas inefficax TaxID=2078786 RepID=A0AAQ1P6L3_9PSED|nr:hypothetical protein [Pseudomonas]SPO56069.1 conserved protein of unknown function [Pseudomonas sp. JV551A1]SPO60801.1 conserved protein of unknown function [Pseudomonas inefficax]
MTGIAAVSIRTTTQAASTIQATDSQDAQKTEESAAGAQADTSKVTGGGQAQGAQGSGESSEPAHIRQLREMIKKLQKQLAEEQKQLAQLMAQKMDETTKLAAVTGKQASIATINGEIMQATAQLLEALQKTGGSSAGGMVSTTA